MKKFFLLSAVFVLSAPFVFCGPAAWELDANFPAPSVLHEVSTARSATVTPWPDGQLLAHGDFTHADGHQTGRLARLRADGRVDSTFAATWSANDFISSAVPLAEGRVLAVRRRASVGEVRDEIVRLLPNGAIDTGYDPLPAVGYPRLMAMPDGRVLAWGTFSFIGSAARNGLARFDSQGALDPGYAPAVSEERHFSISHVAPDAAGNVYVNVSTAPLSGVPTLVRIKADGTLDATFKPALTLNWVEIAAMPDGELIAAAARPVIMTLLPTNGVFYGDLVRFRADGSVDEKFFRKFPGDVQAIAALPNGRITVHVLTPTKDPLPATSAAPSFAPVPEPPISHHTVLILSSTGDVERDLRATFGGENDVQLLGTDSAGQLLVRFGPPVSGLIFSGIENVGSPPLPPVIDVTPVPAASSVVVIGPWNFTVLARATFARVDPVGGTAEILAAHLVQRSPGSIAKIAPDGAGRIVVGGQFTRIAGQSRPGIARFLPGGALDASFAPVARADAFGETLLFVQPDGRIIFRETFLTSPDIEGARSFGTRLQRYLADGAIDASFWPAPELAGYTTQWHAAAPDGRVLVSFFSPDNSREENFTFGWMGPDGRIASTLATRFTGLDSLITLAEAAPSTAIGPAYAGALRAEILPDSRLLVSGRFATVNGTPRDRVVRLEPDGTVDASFLADTSLFTRTIDVARLPDGRIALSGASTSGGRDVTRVRRLLADGARDPEFPDLILPGFSSFRWTKDGWPDLNFPTLRNEDWGGMVTQTNVALAGDGSLWTPSLQRYLPREITGITVQPASQTVLAGRPTHLQVAVGTDRPASYEWLRDGTPIVGARTPFLTFPAVGKADAGTYVVRVSIDGQIFTSQAAALEVDLGTSRLVNFSGRSRVTTDSPQILGLVTRNAIPGATLLRSVGRGLARFGVATPLPEPVLTLREHRADPAYAPELLAEDRGGGQADSVAQTAASVGAFPLLNHPPFFLPNEILGSAVTRSLGAGVFTATTVSGDGRDGVALGEFYDAGGAPQPVLLRNASVRAQTGPGDDVLTVGFSIVGNGPLQLLVRGIGPTLATYGVGNAVADPRLTVFRSPSNSPVAANDDWAGDPAIAAAAGRVGAFALPANSRDAALLLTIEPGVYTIQLAGADSRPAQALAEIYVVVPE